MKYTKNNNPDLKQVFAAAIESFPYKLHPTGSKYGDVGAEYQDMGKGFKFDLAIYNEQLLTAVGWIEMSMLPPGGRLDISGLFTVGQGFDYEYTRTLMDSNCLAAYYDLDQNMWKLSISSY